MMTRSAVESKLLDMFVRNDRAGIDNLFTELTQQLKKLDAWFDKYLDMFDSQMDADNPNTPVWQLYHKKYNEYEKVQMLLNTTKHYRSKL